MLSYLQCTAGLTPLDRATIDSYPAIAIDYSKAFPCLCMPKIIWLQEYLVCWKILQMFPLIENLQFNIPVESTYIVDARLHPAGFEGLVNWRLDPEHWIQYTSWKHGSMKCCILYLTKSSVGPGYMTGGNIPNSFICSVEKYLCTDRQFECGVVCITV